jgi:hypothetical protein
MSGACTPPSGLTDLVALDAGSSFTVALRANGQVACWGNNSRGQCDVPAALDGVVAISAGTSHALALKADGTVVGWGRYAFSNSAVAIPSGLSNVVRVSAGTQHSLALRSDGSVVAWGNYSVTVPVDLASVVAIAAGNFFSVAAKSDGSVVCWGDGAATQSYDDQRQGQSIVPSGLTSVVDVAAGMAHSVALRSDGTVVCWGAGNNPPTYGSNDPNYGQTDVPTGLRGVVAIDAGGYHTVALREDGTVVCWGAGAAGSSVHDWNRGQSLVPATVANVFAVTGGFLHTAVLARSSASVEIGDVVASTCGASTGAIDLNVDPTTTVSWTGPSGFTAASPDIDDLSPGRYRVTVTDSLGSLTREVIVGVIGDQTPPTVKVSPAGASATADRFCKARVPDFAASLVAIDECAPPDSLLITQSPPAWSFVSIGVHTVILTVEDVSGNQASVTTSFTVTGSPQVYYTDVDSDYVGNSAEPASFCESLMSSWVLDGGDECPLHQAKIAPGVCGCDQHDGDWDSDGTPDCIDACPYNPTKVEPGVCGCGMDDYDQDEDGVLDCLDGCPADPMKTAPGECGCYQSDVDTDGDGTADCHDLCPEDPLKLAPGYCGCGEVDIDSDLDGAYDCMDQCPLDPMKLVPGFCGCGVADDDSDGDGLWDCVDGCPLDASKSGPGNCGCGVPDLDADFNGREDCLEIVTTLSLAAGASAYAPGEVLELQVSTTLMGPLVTGARLALHFDPQHLLFQSASAVAGSDFASEVIEVVDVDAGTLKYQLSTGVAGTRNAQPIASIRFVVLSAQASCDPAEWVWFEPVGTFTTALLTDFGVDVPLILSPMVPVRIDSSAPSLVGVPESLSLAVDAGSLTGAQVVEPWVSAIDACDGSVVVSGPVWPAGGLFPIGTTQLAWTASDAVGNSVTATRTITVHNHQLLDLDVNYVGSFAHASARSVRVMIAGQASVHAVDLHGHAGPDVAVPIPVGASHTCVEVKDVTHSLTDAAPVGQAGARYAATVNLRQGDCNDDDMIEIFDYAVFISRRGVGQPSDAIANFDGDGVVGNSDFTFIALSFFAAGESCSSGATAPRPRSRVSVKELRRSGHGDLACADLNGDGWVDLRDVERWIESVPPSVSPE